MKNLLLTLTLGLLLAGTLFAQRTISGEEIIAMLDQGKDVALENVTITGNINFFQLADREEERKEKWGDKTNYRLHVRNKLTFVNCVFEGKLLAYFNDEKGKKWNGNDNVLYNTDFHEAVVFEKCAFRDDAFFKYTRFYEGVSFEQSVFGEEALFKYTKFDEYVNFSQVEFGDEANFKYTNFPEGVSFAMCKFQDDADFKYTEFPDKADFANAVFRRDADFKYTKLSSEANFDNTKFQGSIDFKYTKKGGRPFHPGYGG